MELLQLKYFMSVARKENISHAAQAFMVPPSSVSAAIKKLETELGFCLFDRTANRLKLNEYGRVLFRALATGEREFAQAKVAMHNLSKTAFGEIRMLILTNRRTVTERISRFKLDYPNVSFNIRHEGVANERDYDLMISDQRIDADAFEKRIFMQEEIFLAVPKAHALARAKRVDLKELKDEKFICMPKGSSLGDYMDAAFKKSGILPQVVIECDDPQYIREYLKMGLGITFFPSVSWKSQVDESIRLLRIGEGMQRDSYLYIRKDASDTVRLFAKMLTEG